MTNGVLICNLGEGAQHVNVYFIKFSLALILACAVKLSDPFSDTDFYHNKASFLCF